MLPITPLPVPSPWQHATAMYGTHLKHRNRKVMVSKTYRELRRSAQLAVSWLLLIERRTQWRWTATRTKRLSNTSGRARASARHCHTRTITNTYWAITSTRTRGVRREALGGVHKIQVGVLGVHKIQLGGGGGIAVSPPPQRGPGCSPRRFRN